MTARSPWSHRAGIWVAYYQRGPWPPVYLHSMGQPRVTWTVDRADALRFDTKAEAERVARQCMARHRNQTRGAEKVA